MAKDNNALREVTDRVVALRQFAERLAAGELHPTPDNLVALARLAAITERWAQVAA